MGCQWIRHSTVDLRRCIHPVPRTRLWGRVTLEDSEVGERERVQVVRDECSKEQDMTRGWRKLLSDACPRDEWMCMRASCTDEPHVLNMVCERCLSAQERSEFSWTGDCSSIQKPYNGFNNQWRSADKWRSSSVCLWFRWVLDTTDRRGQVNSSIAPKTLRRPRILLWVGPVVKNHSSSKTAKKIQCNTENYVPGVVPGLSTEPSGSSTSTSSTSVSQSVRDATETPKQKSKWGHRWSTENPVASARKVGGLRSWTASSGTFDESGIGQAQHFYSTSRKIEIAAEKHNGNQIPRLPGGPAVNTLPLTRETEALLQKSKTKKRTTIKQRAVDGEISQSGFEEFTDNLEDTDVPALANTSHDWDSERPTKVVSRKYSIYTHFPKDRNCEVRKKTKITRGPCRNRTGDAVPRAEKLGDLITVGHKVLNEWCESRNNYRYPVVVQDKAIQWIQSYPCKTKTSQETERSLLKFLDSSEKPRVIFTDNSLEFGKAWEELSWNQCTSTPHRSETNGIAERAVRRIQEGTSAVLLQSGLNEKWWADSMECNCYLRKVQDLLSHEKTCLWTGFGDLFSGLIIPFGSMIEYHPVLPKTSQDSTS